MVIIMAEEKIEKAGEKAGKKVGKKKRVKGSNRFARWFREMRSELKKVIWPTLRQIVNNTLVSLSVMVAAAIVVWAIDQAGAQIFQAIRLLGTR